MGGGGCGVSAIEYSWVSTSRDMEPNWGFTSMFKLWWHCSWSDHSFLRLWGFKKIPTTYHAGGAAVHAGDVGDDAVDLLLVVGAEEATDAPSLPLLLLHVGHALAPSLAVGRLAADVHLRTCQKNRFRTSKDDFLLSLCNVSWPGQNGCLPLLSLSISSLCVADTYKGCMLGRWSQFMRFTYSVSIVYSDVICHSGVGTNKAITEAFLSNKAGHKGSNNWGLPNKQSWAQINQ